MADITRSVRLSKRSRNPGQIDLVTQWTLPPYSVEYMIIGSGGGGGGGVTGTSYPSPGGAGQVLNSTVSLNRLQVYNIVVGAAKSPSGNNVAGVSGDSSSFAGLTAGGGGGGQLNPPNGGSSGSGQSGGTGVGSTSGGGAGDTQAGFASAGGGVGGNGGAGIALSITGTSIPYAGGGRGQGDGGLGTAGTGQANYGGGANAGETSRQGVVILKILTTDYSGFYTGTPSIAVSGAYTILTFTSNGSYTA